MKNQNYPEHDTLCLSNFFHWIFPWSMTPCLRILFRHMLLELLRQTYNIILGYIVHMHLGIKYFWTRNLNIRHLLLYISLINGIGSIGHLFSIPGFTYALINYNWVTLQHNWHKVDFRGAYILFSTTISYFPYFT